MVAIRGDEPPVIIELKTRLNLELVLQAADRLNISKSVYIAFPSSALLWRRRWKRVRRLCHRLGVGIITLDGNELKVNVRLEPQAYKARSNKTRLNRLRSEFERRVGNHNVGGVTREPIITAYRQDALRCVSVLKEGELALAQIRQSSRVKRAAIILQKNHYGWFERVSRGVYQLSTRGFEAIDQYCEVLADVERGMKG